LQPANFALPLEILLMRKPRWWLAGACAALALTLLAQGPALAKDRNASGQGKSVSSTPLDQTLAASQRVDQLIEAGYAKHKVKPNPLTSDELFVRRIYLDVVGRIPTYDEARRFLDSKDTNKRSKLIDQLLDSEGFVSHQFNYWADLLRIQSRSRYAPSKPYIDFVKDSVRENKPYDQFVRELITAEGYTWDNGAAGYYIRDTGMPLDNMSNTVQVFLGTQLVCAQCHDHPFDAWTQLEYYQLAAFTYGINTRDRSNPKYAELRQMRRNADMDQNLYRSANRILRPLAYRVHETNRQLRLPADYAYDDAKPRAAVAPGTIFGEKIELKPGESRKEAYARWMTSPTNPRFSLVIANRLWQRAMGVGLIEPVDDLKGGKQASNPELMQFLTEQMVALKFDLKQYLRILYNSKTYQREVTTTDLDEDNDYYFPGPVLRRLSAEQLWDSLLTMTIPDVDERKGIDRYARRYSDGERLVDMEMSEILKMARVDANRRQAQVTFNEKTRDLQKEMRIALRVNDREKADKLRTRINKIRQEVYGKVQTRRPRSRRPSSRTRDPRWAGFSPDLVRASEVESPARPGHFLRQFGQSDRESIENANTEATVPQILTLLNGPVYSQLSSRNSVLSRNLAAANGPEEQLEVLFLSILSRRPSEREKELVLPRLQAAGNRGVSDVIWALINTRQFLFEQ
jgi:hypothetical protein